MNDSCATWCSPTHGPPEDPMSAAFALVLVLSAILLLSAFAGWLLNLPLWLIGAFLIGGGWAIRRLFQRIMGRRARQDTEAPV